MKNEWFLDVLTDLKAFAEANDLCAVSAKLEDVRACAEAEMLGAESACLNERRSGHETTHTGRLH